MNPSFLRLLPAIAYVAAFFPAIPLVAQTPPGYLAAAAPASYAYSPEELQNLVDRVALYPDDLIALILPAQGEAAPAGKFDYLINGHFIGGFALIAWPADYGKTGIMTFLVNHYGDIYEADLGAETAVTAAATTEFNPTENWVLVEE